MIRIPFEHPVVERLLAIMDQKNHWAWSRFTRPGLSRAQHLVHFRHEYATYVRDFPILLARALGQVPDFIEVRRALAENVYEEQTGGLSKSDAHPILFLEMMSGLGYSKGDLHDRDLHPAAQSYKEWLLAKSASGPWQAAVALLTIFVEGSINERGELAGTYVRPRGEAAIDRHPLVLHYGCPKSAMRLVRAHGDVEGGHRGDAWRVIVDHVNDDATAKIVVDTCMDGLVRWQRYRDGVADWMNLERNDATTAPPPVVARAS